MENDNRERGELQGEGNYQASRNYRRHTEEFIRAGRVDRAARDAADASPAERGELERAEREARSHAAEEDPQLRGPGCFECVEDDRSGEGSG